MNETQKQKRKYAKYCLRGINGDKKRKCHTGDCVDQIKKISGQPTPRCKKGTRKCADQQCYPFIKKSKMLVSKTPYNSPKTISNSTDRYISPIINQSDIDNFNEISSPENGIQIHPFIEKEEVIRKQTKSKRRSSHSSKKNKTKKNFTSHGTYGKSKKREKIIQVEEPVQIEEPMQSSESTELLNLPVINNTTSSQRRKKRNKKKKRKSSNRKVKTELDVFDYVPISNNKLITTNSVSPKEEEEELQPIEEISQEELQPIEEISEEEELQPIEEISEEERESSSSSAPNSLKSPISIEEAEEEEDEVAAEDEAEEEEDEAADEEEEEAEEEEDEEAEEEEDEEAAEISGASSIKSENSVGGKKYSKKKYKKRSKKHYKKKYKKQTKKCHKRRSKKHYKK